MKTYYKKKLATIFFTTYLSLFTFLEGVSSAQIQVTA